MDIMNRMKSVISVSLIGIVTNLILVAFKAFVGLLSGSISIISDALNNLSDAISSIVTIIGMLLAGKKPDKNHPYGYGKIEHISALIVGIIIFGTGASLLVESAQKIVEPEVAEFNVLMLIILAVGILMKLFLGRYTKKRGEELNSDSLIASGSDALFDVLISSATLIGALITVIFRISIDGWIGLVISALIIKTAVEIIMDSISHIVGERIDSDLAFKIKKAVSKNSEVLGAYDLTLHQYGPERMIGSIHIEVEDKLTAREIHLLTRKISEKIFDEFGVVLTIGIYAANTEKSEYAEIKKFISDLIRKYPGILQMHGYYVDSEKKLISFDLVFDFKEKDINKIIKEISKMVEKEYPKYKVQIVADTDFSD